MSSETKIRTNRRKPGSRVYNGMDTRLNGHTLQQKNRRTAGQFPAPEKANIGFGLIISYTKNNCNALVIHIHMHFQCII